MATSAYSLPTQAPLYGRPPFAFRDCRLLVLAFLAEEGAAQRLVPEPLVPTRTGSWWLGAVQ